MVSPTIRPAVATDAPVLARMRWDFRTALGAPVESDDAFVQRCEAWMAARLDGTGAWRCWVAETAGRVTGHLWLQLIEKVPNPMPEVECHAYITNVYVQPDARGSGTGMALMEAALAWCRAVAVDSVILWPTDRSRTLYARYGFAPPGDIMQANLDPGRQPGPGHAVAR